MEDGLRHHPQMPQAVEMTAEMKEGESALRLIFGDGQTSRVGLVSTRMSVNTRNQASSLWQGGRVVMAAGTALGFPPPKIWSEEQMAYKNTASGAVGEIRVGSSPTLVITF